MDKRQVTNLFWRMQAYYDVPWSAPYGPGMYALWARKLASFDNTSAFEALEDWATTMMEPPSLERFILHIHRCQTHPDLCRTFPAYRGGAGMTDEEIQRFFALLLSFYGKERYPIKGEPHELWYRLFRFVDDMLARKALKKWILRATWVIPTPAPFALHLDAFAKGKTALLPRKNLP